MDFTLEATTRTEPAKHTKYIRTAGKIPAVLYGKNIENQSITLDALSFRKLLQAAGTSSIIALKIDDKKPVKVLIRQSQTDPRTYTPSHVDFYQVNMKEKIRTEIPLEFVGESSLIVDQDGKLVTNLDAIEVECLPDDLVQHIEVDISKITEFDHSVFVKDLNIPAALEVLTDPELAICLIQAAITEEELEADLASETNEADAVAAVEDAEPKKEDEETSEEA